MPHRAGPAPLGIVIPVRDEAENIGETLGRIAAQVSARHTVYLVHDAPDDPTLPAAEPFRAGGADLVFLHSPRGGAAHAIRQGLRSAPNEALLVTMADGSDDYGVVDRMLELFAAGCDVVCGSRYAPGGRPSGAPALKGLLSRTAGLSLRRLGASPVHDITNSFKLYRRSMLERLELTSDAGFEIGMEIAVKAIAGGYRVAEVPCAWTERVRGESRFRLLRWLPGYLRWYGYALGARFSGWGAGGST